MTTGGTQWGPTRYTTAQECKRKYWLSYISGGEGLVSISSAPAMEFGNACHAAWEWFYTQLANDKDKTLLEFDDHVATAIKVAVDWGEVHYPEPLREVMIDETISGLDQYFQHYEDEIFGRKEGMVPISAETPIQCNIGSDVLTGRVDLVCRFMGSLCLANHKTTSKDWTRFFKGFRLSLSERAYVYTYEKTYGERPAILINAMRRRKTKAFEVEFQRDIFHMSDQDMRDVEIIISNVGREVAMRDPNNMHEWEQSGSACIGTYECDFRKVCVHPELESMYFRQKGVETETARTEQTAPGESASRDSESSGPTFSLPTSPLCTTATLKEKTEGLQALDSPNLNPLSSLFRSESPNITINLEGGD